MSQNNREEACTKLRVCKQNAIPILASEKSIASFETQNVPKHSRRKQQNINKTGTFPHPKKNENLVLWRNPKKTIKYCLLEAKSLVKDSSERLRLKRGFLIAFITFSTIFFVVFNIRGPHLLLLEVIKKNTWFVVHWLGLGILSSVGLGTGLHTFLLYLGPHIASVTLAAYECNSLHFPKPPYPEEIICPETESNESPSIWDIMSKVRLEAFLWGAGTALGELPPYFMAKAARLSGKNLEVDDDNSKSQIKRKMLSLNQGKLIMEGIVNKIGFFGILACASIPNPLFDLAGITCGHFLVPFWKFFGATFIGKAVIKMHIQKIFVIIAFNDSLIQRLVSIINEIPMIGTKLQEPLQAFFRNQKIRLHRIRTNTVAESGNIVSTLFDTFVIFMLCFFIISIIHSLAQNYQQRIYNKRKS